MSQTAINGLIPPDYAETNSLIKIRIISSYLPILSRSGVSFPLATASRIGKYLATVGSPRIQVRKWSSRFACVILGLRVSEDPPFRIASSLLSRGVKGKEGTSGPL